MFTQTLPLDYLPKSGLTGIDIIILLCRIHPWGDTVLSWCDLRHKFIFSDL